MVAWNQITRTVDVESDRHWIKNKSIKNNFYRAIIEPRAELSVTEDKYQTILFAAEVNIRHLEIILS